MIVANLIVCLIYIIIASTTLYFYKLSANNQTQSLPSTHSVTSKQSITVSVSKYLLNRYTAVALRNPDKKYILMQLFSIAVLSVTALNLNKIIFYQLATLPVSLAIGMIVNDVWMLRKMRNNRKDVEQIDLDAIIVQPRWITMGWEQIIRALFASITLGLVLIAGYRVDLSLSNLGELNGLSVLIGLVIDQIVMRPIVGLMIVGGFKITQLLVGNQQTMEYRVMRQILHQQYLRDPTHSNITLEQIKFISQVRISEEDDKTNSPLKLPSVIERSQQNNSNQGTLADRLNRHSSICIEEKEQIKVQDISIIDDINRLEDPTNEIDPDFRSLPPNFDLQTSKGTQENKDQQQQLDMNILKENNNNNNQDLYLANIWPSDQLQLPESMDASPKLKKRRINKKKRVLNLCGNSPYLEYLPNMLKKQESQNKLKSLSKNNLQNKMLGIDNKK